MPSKTLLPLLLAALTATAVAGVPAASAGSLSDMIHQAMGPSVEGSGVIKTETRQLAPFDVVQSNGSVDLDIRIAPQISVTVEADDNLLHVIRTHVEGSTLVVDDVDNWNSDHDVRVHIAMPRLKALGVDGSGDARLIDLSGDKLGIRISGSGDVSGDGHVGNLHLVIEGSGDADLEKLETQSAQVRIDGSGDATVNVAKALEATIDGSGDVSWRGSATDVKSEIYGSGELTHK